MEHSSLRRLLIFSCLVGPFVGLEQLLFAAQQKKLTFSEKFTELEASFGGRLGVLGLNTGNNTCFQYRAAERFPLCSTCKVMAVGAVLQLCMKNEKILQRNIRYTTDELVAWSPVTERHSTNGMRVADLCAAALQYSDNTALNLLVKLVGGPAAVTQFARSIGDTAFRLDRWEPELNTAIPGDDRDTSTPAAMGESLRKLVLGSALDAPRQEQLQLWLKGNTTGDACIRAGVSGDWVVGDKTGSGDYGTTNDIAVLWPPTGVPLILSVYVTQKEKNAPARRDVIASAARLAVEALRQ